MKRKVKITVIRREYYQELADRFLVNPGTGKCSLFEEGQEFIVTKENYDRFPYENKFCMAAWDIIKIKVYSVLQGGNFFAAGLCCKSPYLTLSSAFFIGLPDRKPHGTAYKNPVSGIPAP